MAFSASYFFSATTGLTLKWSLSAAGTLHATLVNQTTGFTEQGTSGLYEWVSSTIPDGYRGCVLWHTNTATVLADFTAANTYGGGSINPGEIEAPESVWARLGAFTGTGLNTVLGAFRAIFNKGAALTPTDLTNGVAGADAGDNTTDSLPALRDRGDAAWVTGAAVSTNNISVEITDTVGTAS